MELISSDKVEYRLEFISSSEDIAKQFGNLLGNWYGEKVATNEDARYQVQGIVRSDKLITAFFQKEIVGVLGLTVHTQKTRPDLFSLLTKYPAIKQFVEIQEFAVAHNMRGKGVSKGLWQKAYSTIGFDVVASETRNPLSAAAIASSLSTRGMKTYWANEQIGGSEVNANSDLLSDISHAYIQALFPDFLEMYETYHDGIVPFAKFSAPTKDRGIHISPKMDVIMNRILKRQQEIGKTAIGLLISIK